MSQPPSQQDPRPASVPDGSATVADLFLPTAGFSIQNRLFRALTLTGGLVTLLLVTPANASMGLPWPAHVATVAFGLTALGAFAAARRGHYGFTTIFVAYLALLDVLWLANSGSLGPTNLFFLVGALYLVLFFTGWQRLLALGFYMANGVAVILLEARHPEWVAAYGAPSARAVDHIIGFTLGSLVCAAILWVVLESYQRERHRLEQAGEAIRERERRYAATFDHAPVAIGIAGLEDSRFLAANEAFGELAGYPVSELLGKSSLTLGLWTEPTERTEVVRRLVAGEEVRNLTVSIRRKDEECRWVSYSAELVPVDGSVGLLSMAVDITEQKRAEEAIRDSEASYRGLFDSVAEAIYIQDGAGTFLDVNRGALRMYGYTREELVGQSPLLVAAPGRNDLPAVAGCLERAFAGEPQAFEFWGLRKNGEVFPKEVRLSRGTYFGTDVVIAVALDISDRKAAEEKRRSLESQLNHLQRMEGIGRLAGGISHDMNNVLAAIMGAAELLQIKAPEHARQADMIHEASVRGRNLLKNLMAFARKEMEDAEFFDLDELVRKEAELLAETTLRKVRVDLSLAGGLPKLMGSSAAVSTALMNLCVNAVDAMPDGGTLRLETRRLDARRVELLVEDTGQGMPPEVLSRAVEPFFTTKPVGKGTGLGLSMVFGTMQAHGGSLTIDSREGEGTRMRLVFPVQAGARPGPSLAATAPRMETARPSRILLVDDDPLIRQTTPDLLQAVGHTVTVASGGHEALGRLETGPAWDLILLDLNMPDMDGLETLGRLRRLHPDLPVCLATGYADDHVRDRLESHGRVTLLPKPYSARELEEALAGFFP